MERILICLPDSEIEIINSFIAIDALKHLYPDCDIQILVNQDNKNILEFASHELGVIAYDKNVSNPFSIHKFIKKMSIVYNIDLYIDLLGSLKSGYFGKGFNVKKKIGLNTKIFGTQERINYLEFINTFFESIGEEKHESQKSSLESFKKELKEESSYISIYFEKTLDNSEKVIQFFDGFFEKKFIFVVDEARSKLIESLLPSLSEDNTYLVQKITELKDSKSVIYETSAVISDNDLISHTSAYHGIPVFSFNAQKVPSYFKTMIIQLPDNIEKSVELIHNELDL